MWIWGRLVVFLPDIDRTMSEAWPNVLVVLGSESGVVRPLVEDLVREIPTVRVYARTTPTPSSGCVDIQSIRDIPSAITQLVPHSPRIGFLGAAFKRQNSLFHSTSAEELHDMIDTNITLYVDAVSVLLPLMIREKYGRLVYLSSFRSENPVRGTTMYSAGKAFGETFFSAIGKEYGRFGVSSVSIRMGYFEGGMFDDYDDEAKRHARSSVSMNRLGSTDDLLASVRACFSQPYLNSGVIELNGGLNLG